MVNAAGLAIMRHLPANVRIAMPQDTSATRIHWENAHTLSRRELIASAAAFGGAAAFGLSRFATAQPQPANSMHAHDWDWLVGQWDVWHSRLKDRLVGSNEWQEFSGKSALWLTMGGLSTIDDNIVELPAGSYRGLTLRAFDPKSRQWAIWWLDGRNPTHIDPPVLGRFQGDTGTFIGRDTFRGRPIVMRFRWNEIHGPRPWWEQAFSTDEGKTWEINWRNYFTRTSAQATPLPKLANAPSDWDFLVGQWSVRHRRLRQRFVGSNAWDEFGGTLVAWPVLGGHGNVGDNTMEFPDQTVRGVGLRAYDPATREWLSWWLDGRSPGVIGAPLRGSFANGVGTFIGDELVDGRPVKTRVQWLQITSRSARWEQASSADAGKTWEVNWISELTRKE